MLDYESRRDDLKISATAPEISASNVVPAPRARNTGGNFISEAQNKAALKRLKWRPSRNAVLPPEPWQSRTVSLKSATQSATVTLTEKFGVWFVTAASGCLSLYDFDKGWGVTDLAVARASRRLGLTISPSLDSIIASPHNPGHAAPVDAVKGPGLTARLPRDKAITLRSRHGAQTAESPRAGSGCDVSSPNRYAVLGQSPDKGQPPVRLSQPTARS